jgi:hypothetical protein
MEMRYEEIGEMRDEFIERNLLGQEEKEEEDTKD